MNDAADIAELTDEEFRALFATTLSSAAAERRENQLLWYRPVSPVATAIHESDARVLGIGGGNGASKTDTSLIEVVMLATGIFPDCLTHLAKAKWRGPVNCRIIVQSLTTTLYNVILPKLQYWKWSGVDQPGGDRGHWGWVPKWCLKSGEWEKSWRDSIKTLTVLCRDPEDPMRVAGESTIQFLSHDQIAQDAASGDFHIILHDEPPKLSMWRESQARTMRVAGRMLVAMTWPDDPAIPVDWIFDEVYEPGMRKERGIEWFNMYTTDNGNLNQRAIAAQSNDWSTETRNVRLYGQPIRFSNRVHPLFSDMTRYWCFSCGKDVIPRENDMLERLSNLGRPSIMEDRWRCETCGSPNVCEYNHATDFTTGENWPVIWLLDPHPRKPHMFLWAAIDPSDDLWVVADGAVDGDPVDVRKWVDSIEWNMRLKVANRIVDPNMALSPASSKRGVSWRDEFDAAGLACALADDSHVGRERVNTYLKPDMSRWQPRLHIHRRCEPTIHQMKRYTWADNRQGSERAQKQIPKDTNDDYPSLLKYLLNDMPTFRRYHDGAPVLRPPGRRKNGY